MNTNSRSQHRGPWFLAALLGSALSAGIALGWAEEADLGFDRYDLGTDENMEESPNGDAAKSDRLREGTKLIERMGYFKLTGDRVTFYTADGNQRFGGLENLTLDRIAQIVADNEGDRDAQEWCVSGIITEYRGTNFLLVTHAVLKNKPQRRTGEK